jgi:hypothetical protein
MSVFVLLRTRAEALSAPTSFLASDSTRSGSGEHGQGGGAGYAGQAAHAILRDPGGCTLPELSFKLSEANIARPPDYRKHNSVGKTGQGRGCACQVSARSAWWRSGEGRMSAQLLLSMHLFLYMLDTAPLCKGCPMSSDLNSAAHAGPAGSLQARIFQISQAFGHPSVALADTGEKDWSLGQILPILLLLLSLLSTVELIRVHAPRTGSVRVLLRDERGTGNMNRSDVELLQSTPPRLSRPTLRRVSACPRAKHVATASTSRPSARRSMSTAPQRLDLHRPRRDPAAQQGHTSPQDSFIICSTLSIMSKSSARRNQSPVCLLLLQLQRSGCSETRHCTPMSYLDLELA